MEFDSNDIVVVRPEIESLPVSDTSTETTIGTDFWEKEISDFSPKQTFFATAIALAIVIFLVWFFGGKRGGK